MLAEEPRAATARIELDDVTNIQYTSGTTGSPKGVLLTHRNLVNNGFLSARVLRYTERDRICLAVPFSHCFGNVIGTMSALASGCALILPNDTFDPRAVLAAVEAERATAIYGVPTMFIAELRHPEFSRFDLTQPAHGRDGGRALSGGSDEAGDRRHALPGDDHRLRADGDFAAGHDVRSRRRLDRRVATVGKAVPCTELKVVDVETRETLERGLQGEICARGYMLMHGYDGDPEATARVVDPDGWFHTGDLGVMREDGYLNITGRAKDMIIRGGENIYPREVEEFLYTHPKIADVQMMGLPHERFGEMVLAWIRLKPGETRAPRRFANSARARSRISRFPSRFVLWIPSRRPSAAKFRSSACARSRSGSRDSKISRGAGPPKVNGLASAVGASRGTRRCLPGRRRRGRFRSSPVACKRRPRLAADRLGGRTPACRFSK